MIPKTVKVSQFRKKLSYYLKQANSGPVVVRDVGNFEYVLIDLDEYNKLNALVELYKEEDPEGAYKKSFVNEMKNILKNKDDIDPNIKSLKDI